MLVFDNRTNVLLARDFKRGFFIWHLLWSLLVWYQRRDLRCISRRGRIEELKEIRVSEERKATGRGRTRRKKEKERAER